MLEIMMSMITLVVMNSWLMSLNMLVFYFLYLLLCVSDYGVFNVKFIMFLLSIWLILMMILCVDDMLQTQDLLMIFLLLLFSLCLTFNSESLILFYMGFEMSILPVLIMIYGWGYQPDRMEAGFYMILYTVMFSLPFLLMIFYFEFMIKSNVFVFMGFMMVFMSKLPMVGFHFWLPRAHVEAPMFGSMVLAGVMLKLGGYGIFKISFYVGDLIYLNSNVILLISILGGLYLSFICFLQSDLKMLVAYSSVVHMSIVLSGLLTMRESGLNGSLYLMVGHGLCSSGLFCILGLIYKRTSSRSIYMNKGFLIFIPTCSMWWFLFCSSNLSFPPSLNLPGEILLFISILSWGSFNYLIMGLLGFVSSMYSIYLFSFTQQGWSTLYYSFNNFTVQESLIMLLHWFPLNLLIMNLSFLSF